MFTELAIDAPYPRDGDFRTSAEYAALCRRTSAALAKAMAAGGERMNAKLSARERRERALRVALPVIVAAFMHRNLGGGRVVRQIQPYVLPSPSLVAADAGDGPVRCCCSRCW